MSERAGSQTSNAGSSDSNARHIDGDGIEWIEYYDSQSNQTFWYNSITGENQWYAPTTSKGDSSESHGGGSNLGTPNVTSGGSGTPGSSAVDMTAGGGNWTMRRKASKQVMHVGDWEEYLDPDSQAAFFYNHVTGASQWERPKEMGRGGPPKPGSSAPSSFAATAATAAGAGTTTVEIKEGGWTMRRQQSKQVMHLSDDWEEYYDNDQQAPFYYNAHTGVTQWERPEGLKNVASATSSGSNNSDQWNLRREASVQVRTAAAAPPPPAASFALPAFAPPPPAPSPPISSSHSGSSFCTHTPSPSPPPPPPPPPSYYVHLLISSSSPPFPLKQVLAVGDWQIYRDPATDRTFYYNAKSGKSQWDAPNDAGLTPVPQTPENFTASTPVQPPPSTQARTSKRSKWERHEDADSGKSYYYNEVRVLPPHALCTYHMYRRPQVVICTFHLYFYVLYRSVLRSLSHHSIFDHFSESARVYPPVVPDRTSDI
jgi:hypothetical protein